MAYSCSFTGHRKIKESHMSSMTDLLSHAIECAYEEGCRDFYTGGAIGFDTLAAKEVIRFRLTHPGVRLILCLPCQDQIEGWSEADQRAYNYILSVADEVIYTRDTYSASCMRERNFLLANKCDILIAYCGRQNSGSSQTIRMAEAMGKDVFNLYNKLDKM